LLIAGLVVVLDDSKRARRRERRKNKGRGRGRGREEDLREGGMDDERLQVAEGKA